MKTFKLTDFFDCAKAETKQIRGIDTTCNKGPKAGIEPNAVRYGIHSNHLAKKVLQHLWFLVICLNNYRTDLQEHLFKLMSPLKCIVRSLKCNWVLFQIWPLLWFMTTFITIS